MTDLPQVSFARGEISPTLYGRTDAAMYQIGLKTCYNMVVRNYGGCERRRGFEFVVEAKDSSVRGKLIPFIYSEDVSYVIELGDHFARFVFEGAQVLEVSTNAYAGGTTYAAGDFVVYGGITYKSLQNANTGHQPDVSPTWWSPNPPHEIVTPWAAADIASLDWTQTADILYVTHGSYPPQTISRVNANKFAITAFQNKYGPFQNINGDLSWIVASSGVTGVVTLTASKNTWTADDVGSLFYIEQQDLANINPWEPGDRGTSGTGCVVGDKRRSDGKTYRASAIAPHPATAGAFNETGSNVPVHEKGKAWDGPGDVRNTGTTDYSVGVEWEYLDSGYGIVLITGYTNSKTVTGVVMKQLPASVVGGIGGATNTWNLSGDGATTVFAIAGATSPSNQDYTVTIDGVGVPSNPYYTPPPGSGTGRGGGGGGPIS